MFKKEIYKYANNRGDHNKNFMKTFYISNLKCFINQIDFSGFLFWKKTHEENSDLFTCAESNISIFHFAVLSVFSFDIPGVIIQCLLW